MDSFFELVAQNDVFAGMSATLTFWFLIASMIMFTLCMRQIYRLRHWCLIAPRERADACLNLSLLLVFANAAYQRALATYSFAYKEWQITHAAAATASIYLPLTLFGMVLFLWWGYYDMFHDHRKVLWFTTLTVGFGLFIGFVWIY